MRRNLKNIFALSFLVLVLVGCKKENKPEKTTFFSYKVKISNHISEPTIINGYYGQLSSSALNSVQADTTKKAKKTKPIRTKLYFFKATDLDKMQSLAESEDGNTYISLKKLKKGDILPKFIIIPNKESFYQFDPNADTYVMLLETSGGKVYTKGELTALPATANELNQLNLVID